MGFGFFKTCLFQDFNCNGTNHFIYKPAGLLENMVESYMLMSLDDEKSKQLAEVMANKTCKKILTLLAEKELSEGDIAKKLKLPINTTEYNLKKLISAGLVEKSQSFFWSIKGKKIPNYRLSNKYIVIAPKSSSLSGLKSLLPALAFIGLGSFLISKLSISNIAPKADNLLMASGAKPVTEAMTNSSSSFFSWFISTPWAIFLAGGLLTLLVYFIFRTFLKGGNNK